MPSAIHTTTMTASRSNSPPYTPTGTRSRSTSATQFGQRLKGIFKFTHSSSHRQQSTSSNPSSSTECLPDRNGTGTPVGANPYFHHQGLPAHNGINGTSTGQSSADGMDSFGGDSFNASELEEAIHIEHQRQQQNGRGSPPSSTSANIKRQLRRVASAPNAQLLARQGASGAARSGENVSANASTERVNVRRATPPVQAPRPPTADGIPPNGLTGDAKQNGYLLPVPPIKDHERPGRLHTTAAFRRTYSSNSIKVRNVEVGPGSFDKIKLLGKGDVGKVYLVREKKSSRLYAMKGLFPSHPLYYSGLTL